MGVILIAPTLIIGIAAQVAVLVTISFFSFFTYSAFSYLLDNHHNQNAQSTHSLQTSIATLVDTLESVLLSLTLLHEQLAEQIVQLQQENEQLTLHISQLSEQIIVLSNQTKQLMETEQSLRATKKELERSSLTLRTSLEQQTELLQKNQKTLAKTTQDYEKSQSELSETVIELSKVKVAMSLAVEKAKHVVGTLQGTVEMLTNNVITDGERRTAFQQRLNDFLNDKEKSFDQVAERICEAEHKLAYLSEEYKRCNQRYHELLDQQEQQVNRLVQLDDVQPTPMQRPQVSPASVLTSCGLFAFDEQMNQLIEKQLPTSLHPTAVVH